MFPKWPYPAGDAVYTDLDGMKIKGYINEITAISRKSRDDGNQYWGRITGSPYDKMTTDWVAAQFKRIGLEQIKVAGVHRSASAVVADVVGSDRGWRRQERSR